MIEQEVIVNDQTDKDFEFSLLIWLNGSNEDLGRFHIKFHRPGDKVLNVASSLEDIPLIKLGFGKSKYFQLNYQYRQDIRDCDPSNRLLTSCFDKYMDQEYGYDYNKSFVKKNVEIFNVLSGPTDELFNKTGCMIPCHSFVYRYQQSIDMVMFACSIYFVGANFWETCL